MEPISNDLRKHINLACDEFEDQLKAGGQPRIEDYLGTVPASATSELLMELLKIEFFHRNELHETFELSNYLRRFPDFPSTVKAAFQYIGKSDTVLAVNKSTSVRPIGDFTLLEKLGRGGAGTVYRAKAPDGETVAVKLIHKYHLGSASALARFEMEAASVRDVDHPGIVPVREIIVDDHCYGLVMPLIQGNDLSKAFESPPDWKTSARIVASAAVALQFMHDRGIIHRDVKPSNIILDDDGQVWLADFGLAHSVSHGQRFTATGDFLGTPSYMAPEQAENTGDSASATADIYSLGCVLYFLLTGRPPFAESTPIQTVLKLVTSEPAPPRQIDPSIPYSVESICLQALNKEPQRRYQSAAELAADLDRAISGRRVHAKRMDAFEKLTRWCNSHRLVATSVVATSLLLVAVAVLWLHVSQTDLRRRQVEMQNESLAAQTKAERQQRLLTQEVASHRLYHQHFRRANEALRSQQHGWRKILNSEIQQAVSKASSDDQLVELRSLIAASLGRIDLVEEAIIGQNFHGFCLDFHPHGSQLVVGQHRGDFLAAVKIFDVNDRSLRRTLTFKSTNLNDPMEGVQSIRFSPTGEYLVVGSRRGVVHCWDTADWKHVSRQMSPAAIRDVCFFESDRFFAVSEDGGINAIEISGETVNLIGTHQLHLPCSTASVSSDAKKLLLASVHETQCYAIESEPSKVSLRLLKTFPGQITVARFVHHDRSFIASVAGNFVQLNLRDFDQDKASRIFADTRNVDVSHSDELIAIDVAHDRLLASSSWDQTCKLWDIASGTVQLRLRFLGAASVFPRYSPNGESLAVLAEGGVRVFRVDDPGARKVHAQTSTRMCVARFDRDGHVLTLEGDAHRHISALSAWKVGKPELVHIFSDGPVVLNPESQHLTVTDLETIVCCFGSRFALVPKSGDVIGLNNRLEKHCSVAVIHGGPIVTGMGRDLVVWSEQGKELDRRSNTDHSDRRNQYTSVDAGKSCIAAGSLDHSLQTFEWTENRLKLKNRTELSSTVHAVNLNESESKAIAGTFDGRVSAVDTRTGSQLWSTELHPSPITCILDLPDRMFVSSTVDGQLAFWKTTPDWREPEVIFYLQLDSPTPVTSLDEHDGELLVTQEGSHAAISWNIRRILQEFRQIGLL